MRSTTLLHLLSMPLLGMAGYINAAEWVRIDDFQDQQPGPFQRQESGWHLASSVATLVEVADDRDNPGNRALKMRHIGKPNSGDHDILWQNTALAISPGQSGSAFLRFKVENGTDELGNTNGSEPVQSISLVIALGPTKLHAGNSMGGVRIAGKQASLVDFRSKGSKPAIAVKRNRWYRLWLLIDNRPGATDNRSTAYLQEEGSTEAPKALAGTFLRDGPPGIISSVGFIKARDSHLTDVWIDDVSIDPNTLNTTDPVNGKSQGWRERFAMEAEKYRQYTTKADTWEQAREQAQHLVTAMTPAERFALVCGDGAAGTPAFLRYGILDVQSNDASCGINNGAPGSSRRERLPKTISYPSLCLLAATWDPEVAKAYGKALGEECRSGGTKVLLGPGMNISRASICGRNFEYLGEDPLLAGRMVAGYVQGMQSTGTAATLKHFIGNELESHRRGTNSIIDERALHEIYMPPFKAGIDAGALAVMTSYNQLNGEWASESRYVNTTLLRQELAFPGVIMTDWIAAYDGLKVAASGTDLEMPFGGALARSREALLGSAHIDRMCQSVLATWIKAGFFDPQWIKPELEKHRSTWESTAHATNIAGIVLLQNNGILPLSGGYAGKTILVTGANSQRKELSGNGSGHVPGYDGKTYLDMCRDTFPQAMVVATDAPTADEIHRADLILAFPGFMDRPRKDWPGSAEGEGQDRSFVMPDDTIIAACTRGNPRTIVCVVAGAGVAMDWADQAAAILHVAYGGQTGAKALSEIITGKEEPGGRLPFTIERRFEDSPAIHALQLTPDPKRTWSPDDIEGMARSNFFTDPISKRLMVADVRYDEGFLVGYRWYDEKKISVRFPFGHGLGYTTFAYTDLTISKTGDHSVRCSFTLTNTGKRPGSEVAQVYVSPTESSLPRPPQELKGFQKITLNAGQSQRVHIDLDARAFSYWNPAKDSWMIDPGHFNITIASSSAKHHLKSNISW